MIFFREQVLRDTAFVLTDLLPGTYRISGFLESRPQWSVDVWAGTSVCACGAFDRACRYCGGTGAMGDGDRKIGIQNLVDIVT